VKQTDCERLGASAQQAGAIRRERLQPGRVVEWQAEDVRAMRSKLAQSQEGFALTIGVSVATL